ncbi:MAG: hypothetical protein KDC07_08025 [Chitinophagaceae bacterium]|nr:hypothetical protein [Chitinophagaceae bacterium]
MRRFFLSIAILLSVLLSFGNKAKAQRTSVTFSVFYDELSPYGVWVNDPQYGYVWVPDAVSGFQPYYTNGYWLMTEYGNTWVSGYPWGWAPFHYGRWIYDAFYGWVWVPGYDWGPAWVYWRYGAGYYGWAPLMPGFAVTVSMNVYTCPMDWWVFLPPQYLYKRNFTYHVRDRRYNLNTYNQTTIINNTYINRNTTYVSGPTRDDYRNVSGRDVDVYTVKDGTRENSTYVKKNTVHIYRPEINKADNVPAPTNTIRNTRSVGEPVPVSTNSDRPAPFVRETERSSPSRPVTQPPMPVQREPQRSTPAQREPVQRSTPSTTPTRTPRSAPPTRRAEPVKQDRPTSRPPRER